MPGIDISLIQVDSPDPTLVGSNLAYTLIATNDGLFDATGVTLIGNFPDGINLVSFSANQGTCG